MVIELKRKFIDFVYFESIFIYLIVTQRCANVNVLPPAVEIPKTLKYIIGTSRYVLIDDLDIGIKNFEDLEIGEPVNCKFIHRSREYILKCSIVSNAVELHVPGSIDVIN